MHHAERQQIVKMSTWKNRKLFQHKFLAPLQKEFEAEIGTTKGNHALYLLTFRFIYCSAHWDCHRKRKNKEIEVDRNFPKDKVVIFGVKILHIWLDSKSTLNSASKLNVIQYNTNAS